jgi:hypothetical protein
LVAGDRNVLKIPAIPFSFEIIRPVAARSQGFPNPIGRVVPEASTRFILVSSAHSAPLSAGLVAVEEARTQLPRTVSLP